MPTIKDIKISDAEFTAMQELATAWILKRAFEDNIKFKSEEDIVKDAPTLKGLQNIFKYQAGTFYDVTYLSSTKKEATNKNMMFSR